MTPYEAVVYVEEAKNASVLLGGDPAKQLKELRRLLHPDRFGKDIAWAKRAETAIFRLEEFYQKLVPKKDSASIKLGNWRIIDPIQKGDIADLYHVESSTESGLLKIARSVRDNDLIENESSVLKSLHSIKDESTKAMQRYIPNIFDSFRADNRTTNVLSFAKDFYTLEDLVLMSSPVDFRHVIWMMNRALSILGYIHLKKIIHGAINPRHLLYSPYDHGLCLIDWCYASTGSPIKALVKEFKEFYPPEVIRKNKPTPATDIYMLAKCLSKVSNTIPKRFQSLFDLCLLGSPASRPQDAWEFQDKWRKAAEEEYGTPKFLPLILRKH